MYVKNLGMTAVKGTQFLDMSSVEVNHSGVVGDRSFMFLNSDNQPISPGWHRFFLPLIFQYEKINSMLSLTFPNSSTIVQPCQLSDEVEDIDFIGIRRVKVRKVLGEWSPIIRAFTGKNVSLVKIETNFTAIDILPITLFTSGSLQYLQEKIGKKIDHRIFRSNIIIDNDTPFIEDFWENKLIQIGTVRLKVRSSVPRCVITQMNPVTGKNEINTVASLSKFREKVHLPDNIMPEYKTPGFASYAEVVLPGEIYVGDKVFLI